MSEMSCIQVSYALTNNTGYEMNGMDSADNY